MKKMPVLKAQYLFIPAQDNVHGEIHLTFLDMEKHLARLDEAVVYYHKNKAIVIPKGFVLDGASVPWPVKKFIKPFGVLLVAAVLHDWLYATTAGKKYADKAFLDIMKKTGVNKPLRYAAYRAVCRFGWFAYLKHYYFKPRIENIEAGGI